MLDLDTRKRIDNARDILVGKVPDPKSQVEQITIALIYKFMDDMDKEAEEFGGKASFFKGEFAKYSWSNIFDPKIGGYELINLYGEAITKMNQNKYIPQLFRDIFKNAFLPYRDPETLKSFLKEINAFKYDHSERLGDAFEYLLSVLGVQGDAGSLRTPRHIIDFIVEVIAPKKTETILDPACGTAGFLISAYKHILNSLTRPHESFLATPPKSPLSGGFDSSSPDKGRLGGVSLTPDEKARLMNNVVGYDISPDMVRLSLVNMYLHGFQNPKIYEYDSLTSDERWNDTFDVILANPPFMTPKGGIRPHKRFSIQANRSEVLFVDYIMEHLATDGRAGVIVPEGIIFQSGNAYKALRKTLVENNYLYAVVSLPAGVFNPYSGVKTSILLMDRTLAKKTDNILFVKIKNDGFDLGAQRRESDKNDLPDALKILKAYQKLLQTDSKPPLTLSGEEVGSEYEPFIPYNRKLTEIAKLNRKNPTKAENKIWNDILRRKQFENYKFIRQKPIDNFIVDFYCSKLKLVIEIDGDSHSERQEYDDIRTEILQKYGLNVVRYTNDDVLNNIEGVYEDLIKKITPPNLPLSPQTPPNLPLSGEELSSPPDKGDLGGLFHLIQKAKIAAIGDYNLTGDRYRERIVHVHKDWPMVELMEVAEVISGQSPEGKHYNNIAEGTPFYQGKADFGDIYLKATTTWTTQVTKIAEKSDILMSVRAPVGPVNISPSKICIGRGLAAIRPLNKLNFLFLFYVLRESQNIIKNYGSGSTFESINRSQIEKLKIPLPPLSVQQEIVAEIAGYQRIIDGARQVVENYKPKIKIDESWPMVELGEVCNLMTGGTPTSSVKEYYENGTISWLVSGDIHKGEIFNCEGRITKKGVENSNAKFLPKDSVLIALNGQGKTRGTVALLRMEKSTCNQSLVSIDPKNKNILVSEFIYHQLKSMYQEIRKITGDNQRSGLNIPIIKTIKIPLPPLEVQKQIVAQIEEEQKLIEANKKLIEIFEGKIKAKIAEMWGDESLADDKTELLIAAEEKAKYGGLE